VHMRRTNLLSNKVVLLSPCAGALAHRRDRLYISVYLLPLVLYIVNLCCIIFA